MDLKITRTDDCHLRLSLTLPYERVREEVDEAYRTVAKRARIPGFRPGKAPRSVLEMHYGGDVAEKVKEKLVFESLTEALARENISPAAPPRVDATAIAFDPDRPFEFSIDIEVWPNPRVGNYTAIRVDRKIEPVTERTVDNYLSALRERHAEFSPVEDRPLAAGDFAAMDLTATINGEPFKDQKGIMIKMASDQHLPGFCEQLAGLTPGEERRFTLPLPEDADDKLRGRKADFVVNLLAIKKRTLRELDETFCREIADVETVDALRAKVREQLENTARARAEGSMVEQIYEHLLAHHTVTLPEQGIKREAELIAQHNIFQLMMNGLKEEDITRHKEKILTSAREQAVRQRALSCILREIGKKEDITVSDDDIAREIASLAQKKKMPAEEYRAMLEEKDKLRDIERTIIDQKVTRFLVTHAKVKDSRQPFWRRRKEIT